MGILDNVFDDLPGKPVKYDPPVNDGFSLNAFGRGANSSYLLGYAPEVEALGDKKKAAILRSQEDKLARDYPWSTLGGQLYGSFTQPLNYVGASYLKPAMQTLGRVGGRVGAAVDRAVQSVVPQTAMGAVQGYAHDKSSSDAVTGALTGTAFAIGGEAVSHIMASKGLDMAKEAVIKKLNDVAKGNLGWRHEMGRIFNIPEKDLSKVKDAELREHAAKYIDDLSTNKISIADNVPYAAKPDALDRTHRMRPAALAAATLRPGAGLAKAALAGRLGQGGKGTPPPVPPAGGPPPPVPPAGGPPPTGPQSSSGKLTFKTEADYNAWIAANRPQSGKGPKDALVDRGVPDEVKVAGKTYEEGSGVPPVPPAGGVPPVPPAGGPPPVPPAGGPPPVPPAGFLQYGTAGSGVPLGGGPEQTFEPPSWTKSRPTAETIIRGLETNPWQSFFNAAGHDIGVAAVYGAGAYGVHEAAKSSDLLPEGLKKYGPYVAPMAGVLAPILTKGSRGRNSKAVDDLMISKALGGQASNLHLNQGTIGAARQVGVDVATARPYDEPDPDTVDLSQVEFPDNRPPLRKLADDFRNRWSTRGPGE